jgi:hypothetical protein
MECLPQPRRLTRTTTNVAGYVGMTCVLEKVIDAATQKPTYGQQTSVAVDVAARTKMRTTAGVQNPESTGANNARWGLQA